MIEAQLYRHNCRAGTCTKGFLSVHDFFAADFARLRDFAFFGAAF
jgi:hypothetical protein